MAFYVLETQQEMLSHYFGISSLPADIVWIYKE